MEKKTNLKVWILGRGNKTKKLDNSYHLRSKKDMTETIKIIKQY